MSGQTGVVTSSNNMRCKMPHEETRSRWPSFSTIAKITCLVVPIIAYLGQGFITERPACVQWNKEVQQEEFWATRQKEQYEIALDEYHDRAELNCEWGWRSTRSFASRSPEIVEFCTGWNEPRYPIEKIPSVWKIQTIQRDPYYNLPFDFCAKHRSQTMYSKLPGIKLSCFAEQMIKAQSFYKYYEQRLNNTLADKPLLCSRGEKA